MGTKITLTIVALLLITWIFFVAKPESTGYVTLNSYKEEITYYRSGNCGCCSVHSDYLTSKGKLNIKNINVGDVEAIKEKYNIPSDLWSCHTAIAGDYFIEGHIPLEAIDKLLTEKPNIVGIAMPGMPSGSPGMTGAKKGDFIIYSVNKDRTYQEFMKI